MERRVEWNFGVTCRGDELRRLSSEKSLPCLCWKIHFGIENLEISVNKNIFSTHAETIGEDGGFSAHGCEVSTMFGMSHCNICRQKFLKLSVVLISYG